MQEMEVQAYWTLIQDLLNCPPGGEQALLAARQDIVNEGFVGALLGVALPLLQEGDVHSAPAGKFLMKIAQDLSVRMDFDISNFMEFLKLDQQQFLLRILKSVSDSGGNPQIVYPVLEKNLDLLQTEVLFVEVFRDWAKSKFHETYLQLF